MRTPRPRRNGNEVKRLHDMGFAVHWLHPKSKKPIGELWTSGPALSWSELLKTHQREQNVGVRLGSVSAIPQGDDGIRFLAVIDCDVKSKEPRHHVEMLEKLEALLPASVIAKAPIVASGRGNGSQHVYVVTKVPTGAQRLSQSSEIVKVFMPSMKKISKRDRENLSEKELTAGYRIRPAWEISLMGNGQQVVLPPSIHPDSGELYEWKKPLLRAQDLPLFKPKKSTSIKGEKSDGPLAPFKPVTVDLVGSNLSDKTVNAILDGDGVEDRSASLLGVANQMLKAGFNDQEILTVLTDRDYYLGEAAYEHTQSDSRARAAEWVRRYTLAKSKKETLASEQFLAEVEETVVLSPEEAAAQLEELAPEDPDDWRELIERTAPESGYRPKNTLRNVILILTGEGGKDCFVRDEFANTDSYKSTAPWGGKVGAEITDLDTVLIKEWLARSYQFEPSNDRINEAIAHIAHSNRFHPVRDYLDTLEWDGTPRIDSWLKDYLGATSPEPYLSAISRKTLCAMVKRIYEPGCKFDHVLILEGNQGAGKSTALRFLASDAWFTDSEINVSDKDAVMTMRSKWLIELGELSGMRSADVELLKAFVSRTEDRIRVPYGKRAENFPRQCIFIGSTNREEYLKDPTGNRRFWPVRVGECDFDRVKLDRDQLLAEAKVAYELGEPLYLEEKEMVAKALDEQNARSISDSFEELLEDWIAKGETDDEISPRIDRTQFAMMDLFNPGGPFADWKANQPELKRATDALRKVGFKGEVCWDKESKRARRFWVRKGPWNKKKP